MIIKVYRNFFLIKEVDKLAKQVMEMNKVDMQIGPCIAFESHL